jgi:rfaE bifunctional protein kinase chain/domain
MVDHYLMGHSDRISPEADVPVIQLEKDFIVPGGAGNVAMNLNSLGANVACVGCLGDDVWAEKLIAIFKEKNINTDYLEKKKGHKTTVKKRIYCNNKQVARVDIEEFLIEWQPEKNIIYEEFDVILLSDYNKGVFAKSWLDISGKMVLLDPKKVNTTIFESSNIITPNIKELEEITKNKVSSQDSIINACNQLIANYNFDWVLAKKGSKGITLVGKNNVIKNFNGKNVKNPDVTGAGDTVIATLAVLYAKTKDIEYSVKIANEAAAIVVNNIGTDTINISDLDKLLSYPRKKSIK